MTGGGTSLSVDKRLSVTADTARRYLWKIGRAESLDELAVGTIRKAGGKCPISDTVWGSFSDNLGVAPIRTSGLVVGQLQTRQIGSDSGSFAPD